MTTRRSTRLRFAFCGVRACFPNFVLVVVFVAAIVLFDAIQAAAMTCPNVTEQPSGPTPIEFLKIFGAAIAIVAGVLSAVIDTDAKWFKYTAASLIVLGTSVSFVIDRQKDHEDERNRNQLLACVEQVESKAIELQKLTAQSRADQDRLFKQQNRLVLDLRQVATTTSTSAHRLADNVTLSQKNLESTFARIRASSIHRIRGSSP